DIIIRTTRRRKRLPDPNCNNRESRRWLAPSTVWTAIARNRLIDRRDMTFRDRMNGQAGKRRSGILKPHSSGARHPSRRHGILEKSRGRRINGGRVASRADSGTIRILRLPPLPRRAYSIRGLVLTSEL